MSAPPGDQGSEGERPRPSDGARSSASGLARATLIIVVFTGVSRVLGFLREAVFAALFGASGELDAYLVAQGLPNIVITLIATAVVTASIPVLAGYLGRGEGERARDTFNSLFTFVLLGLLVASAAMAVFADPLIRLTAPGFDEGQVDLAVRLARILLVASVFVAAMNLITGLLQAHREFFWPAIVGIPFNLVMITAAVLFGGDVGVVALAVGFVVASVARVVVQFPGLRKIRYRPAPRFDWRDPGLRTVLRLAPFVLIGHSIANVNTFVDRLVGSTQVEGTISALNYGFRLITLPQGLLGLALVQAFYPSLAIAGSAEDRAEFRELMRRGLLALSVVMLPIVAVTAVLRVPIVELVYERGSFSVFDVALTADAVAFYALGLSFLAWRELTTRAFYAREDARTPVVVALIGMAVNVAGDLTLGRAFGVAGLAASTSLSLAVSTVLLMALLDRKLGLVSVGAFARSTAKAFLAAAAAALAMHLGYALLHGALVGGELGAGVPGKPRELVLLLGPGLIGLGVYLVVLRVVAPRELAEVVTALRAGLRLLRPRRERDRGQPT